MMNTFTKKQTELVSLFKRNKLKRLNILEGSVRSGKTWISLVLWALWVATMPNNGSYLMVAKTLTSLKRNCLDLLQSLVGKKHFTYSLSKKEGRLFGRLIYLEGVNDARAEAKIRGMTLQGAYCDEITLFTEDFFSMLLSRLSERGAKLFGTTNPDNPLHWFKVTYLDRRNDLNMLVMKFLIDDNTTLDPEYVEDLKKEYVGVFYLRYILGQWVVAEGLIYPKQAEGFGVVPTDLTMKFRKYVVSIDYGTMNPCSMGLWGLHRNGIWHRVNEYYHSGRDTNVQMTDEQYYKELVKLIDGKPIDKVIIDPSAASFITTIRNYGKYKVRKADNAVVDGIRNTSKAFQLEKIKIFDCCEALIKEFSAYRWDESCGEDRPIKESDHACDDLRYFVNTALKGDTYSFD